MKVCKYCGSPMYGFDAEVCQNCHKTQGHPYMFMMIVVIIAFSVVGIIKTMNKDKTSPETQQAASAQNSTAEKVTLGE